MNSLRYLVLVIALWIGGATALAQTESSGTTPPLPEPLSVSQVHEYLGQLSDKEVREALTKQLIAVAEKAEEEQEAQQSFTQFVGDAFGFVGASISIAVQRIPNIAEGLATAGKNFVAASADGGLWWFAIGVAIVFLAGYLAQRGFDLTTRAWRKQIQEAKPESLKDTVRVLGTRLGLDFAKIVVFAIVCFVALGFVGMSEAHQQIVWRFISWIVLMLMIFSAVSAFLMAPRRPDLRMLYMDDLQAKRMYWMSIGFAFMIGLNPFVFLTLGQLGVPLGSTRLGFWINLGLYVYIIVAMISLRKGVSQALIGNDEMIGETGKKVARAWPFKSVPSTTPRIRCPRVRRSENGARPETRRSV